MIGKYRVSTILVILLFSAVSGYSQSHIQLRTFGKQKVFNFYIGEEMTFRLEGQKNVSRGYIVDIPNDSTIRFYSGFIPVSKIVAVDVSDKKSQNHWTLAIGGVGYVALEALNSRIVQNRKFQSDAGLWVPAGGLVASAFLINWLRGRWFKVGLRKKVEIVGLPEELTGN